MALIVNKRNVDVVARTPGFRKISQMTTTFQLLESQVKKIVLVRFEWPAGKAPLSLLPI